MSQTAHDILASLDARLSKGEILEQDYHALRLRLLKELRLAQDSGSRAFEAITIREVKDGRGNEFCKIDDGPFLYGAEDQIGSVKAPFYLAKFPVTVREFITFVEESGYNYPDAEVEQMMLVSPGPDCPASHISFLDAKEYCRWLRKTTQEYYSLPHEVEWEKAARGIDGRLYPWGSAEPGPEHACFQGEKTYDSTMPVTRYTLNKSPYGCMDMVGNVWEWCLDSFEDPREPHLLRGGGWCNPLEYANCLARTFSYPPDKRIDFGGFRLLYLPSDMLVDYRRQHGDAAIAGGKQVSLRVVKLDKKSEKGAGKSESLKRLSEDLQAAMARAAGGQGRAGSDVIISETPTPAPVQDTGGGDDLAPAPLARPPGAVPPTVGRGIVPPPIAAADEGPKPVVLTHKSGLHKKVPPGSKPSIPTFEEDATPAPAAAAPLADPMPTPPPVVAAKPAAPAPLGKKTEGGEELNEYMAQVISNASMMYLRSKEKKPATTFRAMVRQSDGIAPTRAASPASVASPASSASPPAPEPEAAADESVEENAMLTTVETEALIDDPVPMASLGEAVDEAQALKDRRAARAAKRIGNSPLYTWGAVAVWALFFIAALAHFVRHLANLS